ncbi:DUF2860 family protein [Vibrio alfacsensis]|uniref:DUF2860 family protein n=1 Tax=Vibrio alfacsensis TaxID=1074311 RepID=UPI004068BB68
MKSNQICALAFACGFTASALAFDSSRISGEVSFNGVYTASNSNLNSNGDKQLGSLGDQVSYTNNYILAPLGNIQYALNSEDTHRVYIGTSRDDLAVGTLAFEIGYQHDLSDGTKIDFAYLPTVLSGEVWENPFLVGENRTSTDIDGNAYRIKLSNIKRSGISLDMGYASSDVKNERISYRELHRDADSLYLKGQYFSTLSRRSGMISSISYTGNNADGKAASYHRYKADLTYFLRSTNYSLALTGSYAFWNFNATNPIFNKIRSDDSYRLFLAYEYKNIPNWDNWSVTSFASSTLRTSNIDFYESNDLLMSIGLNYKF